MEEITKVNGTNAQVEPTEASKFALFQGFNSALGEFSKANPNVDPAYICSVSIQLFLNFPYSWLGPSKTQNTLPTAMEYEAKQFLSSAAKKKQQEETQGGLA